MKNENEKTVLVLRTSDKDGKAHGGFQWPESGMVECSDWKNNAECGNGLHGILWPEGDWSNIKNYDEEIWQVVKVKESDIVKIGGKVKFPRGEVVYSGGMAIAFTMVAKEWMSDIPRFISETAKDGKGDFTQNASSGCFTRNASSGDFTRHDHSGKYSVTACSGSVKKFRLGENGCITVPWNDGKRTRFAIGYVGENIKQDVWYSISETGEFVEI